MWESSEGGFLSIERYAGHGQTHSGGNQPLSEGS
jgi:hypothetical protein